MVKGSEKIIIKNCSSAEKHEQSIKPTENLKSTTGAAITIMNQ